MKFIPCKEKANLSLANPGWVWLVISQIYLSSAYFIRSKEYFYGASTFWEHVRIMFGPCLA